MITPPLSWADCSSALESLCVIFFCPISNLNTPQAEAVSSCPFACYSGEETDPHLARNSFLSQNTELLTEVNFHYLYLYPTAENNTYFIVGLIANQSMICTKMQNRIPLLLNFNLEPSINHILILHCILLMNSFINVFIMHVSKHQSKHHRGGEG